MGCELPPTKKYYRANSKYLTKPIRTRKLLFFLQVVKTYFYDVKIQIMIKQLLRVEMFRVSGEEGHKSDVLSIYVTFFISLLLTTKTSR